MMSPPPQPPGAVILDILGVRVAVVVPHREPDELRRLLGSIVVDVVSEGLPAGSYHCSVEVDTAEVEEILRAALYAAVEHSDRLLLHAGAVAVDGRVVLFPGPTGTGKSTITAACVQRGLDYLTDEAVAVDMDTGRVTGLARPIMLTPWAVAALGISGGNGQPSWRKHPVFAEQLGSAVVAGPLPVEHVVVVRHQGTPVTALMPMSPGEALTQVLVSSFNHYQHGEAAWEAAVRMASGASGWFLDVADPEAAAEAVTELPSLL